jgi:uncharacterized Zn-finger protein
MQPFETIQVDTPVVACAGEAPSGHPKVYLSLAAHGSVECPYCSRLFVRRAAGHDAAVATPGRQASAIPPAGT